jgi:hypothetical protein
MSDRSHAMRMYDVAYRAGVATVRKVEDALGPARSALDAERARRFGADRGVRP